MTSMLQALQQIQSRTDSSPPWPTAAWSADGEAAPPLVGIMDSMQQLGDQVEAALAVEEAVERPAATAAAATTTMPGAAADPYSVLADAVVAQLSPLGAAALMFTSAGDDQGRSAVVARLAAALALRISGRVLAIDGDAGAATLAAHLGVQPAAGLSEVLAGTATWDDAVRPTVMRGLSILPGGSSAGGEAADIEPTAMAALLAEVRKHYRLVLIEAASLGHAATAPLAACCDGTYLVVRLGWNTRRQIVAAAAALQQCQGRLLGCIAVD